MALTLKNSEAEKLARQLAKMTGEGLTQTIMLALKERLERLKSTSKRSTQRDAEDLLAWVREIRSLPNLDPRPWREIEAEQWDEDGLPRE